MADEEVKQEEQKAGAPAWMCTFADLMSLLMCFFVLLLSFSVMDNQKYKQVAGSMEKAFGVQKEIKTFESLSGQQMISQDFQSVPLDVQVRLQEILADEVAGGVVEVEHGAEGMVLRVKGSLAFASGSAEITDRFRGLLDKLGRVAEKHELHWQVGGHTDNVPIKPGGPYSSNYALSAARAVAVVDYWRQHFKLPPEKVSAVGYADGVPVASNNTAAGRERNRRVEFKIRPLGENFAFEGISEILDR